MKRAVTVFLISLVTALGTAMPQKPAGSGGTGGYKDPRTLADPFGLSEVGMPKRTEKHSVVATPGEKLPAHVEECGAGVFAVRLRPGPKKTLTLVVITFEPHGQYEALGSPSPLPVPSPSPSPAAKRAGPGPVYRPPPGYAALTFAWPPLLRVLQEVRLERAGPAEEDPNRAGFKRIELPAAVDLKEDDKAWLAWTLDTFTGHRVPELTGNAIVSNPLLLQVRLPKPVIQCLGKKQ